MGRLDGKVAVVTGATSGIGNATAWLFAREGAKVVMGARRAERGVKIENDMIAEGLEAKYIKTDVSVASECFNLINKAIETYGRVDILANIAGVGGGKKCRLHEVDDETRDKLIRTNLYSIIDLCRAAIPHMLEQKSGSIVNVSSVAAMIACPYDNLYNAVKGAVNALTIGMAHDYGRDGIRVNCLCPGLTRTEMASETVINASYTNGHTGIDFADRILSNQPMGRIAEPEEIAQGILFLASDEASFACGAILTLDGGEIIS